MCVVILYLCFLVQLDDGLFIKLKHAAVGCKKICVVFDGYIFFFVFTFEHNRMSNVK